MPFLGSLAGHIHQGNLRTFGCGLSFGTQCTAIALVALIFSGFHLDPQFWNREDIDNIVFEGDGLYQGIICDRYRGNLVQLAHDDIPSQVDLFEQRYLVNLENTFYGIVNNVQEPAPHERDSLGSRLHTALEISQILSPFILCTFNDISISIFFNRSINAYYIFDSHSRDYFGNVDPFGAAVMLHFSDLESLETYLQRNYYNAVFNISPISLTRSADINHSFCNLNSNGSNKICSDSTNATCSNGVCEMSTDFEESSEQCFLKNYREGHFENVMLEHSYTVKIDEKPKRGKVKSMKKNKDKNVDQTHNLNIDSVSLLSTIDNIDFDVACCVEVDIEDNFKPNDRNTNSEAICNPIYKEGHIIEYEQLIQENPNYFCGSCDRFLFKNQAKKIMPEKLNNLTSKIGLSSESYLCCTCKKSLSENKIPTLCGKLNNLSIDAIPLQVSCLSKLEKKLIAKIQTFMTLIILPGGQYAEKGMVLNLPRDVNVLADQLFHINNNDMCIVKFEAGKIESSSAKFLVSPMKIKIALQWLKENNKLYSNLNVECDMEMDESTNSEFHDGIELNEIHNLENISLIPVNFSNPNEPFSHLHNEKKKDQENSIFLPKINEKPVSIYEIESGEECAFPWLFPSGRFGFMYPRDVRISPAMYFRYRLYNKNGFWRKNTTYLLHAAVSYDTLLLKQEINVYMKTRKASSEPVKVADVISSQINSEILQNSYMFMKNIRGTVAYFRNALYDLLAMFRSLGPPTIFLTLSADDLHWPELGMMLESCTYEEAVKKKTFLHTMREDPLMTAIHFERRFTALLNKVIMGPSKPLGNVKDYFVRVEFQNRGSPHYHSFFWISDIPSVLNSSTNDVILKYIDSHIKTDIPEDDGELRTLVCKLQQHGHSSYCMPSSKSLCRFGFPKRVCPISRIIHNGEIVKNKGKFYETKRSNTATYVNAYNPTILLHWRANMDIQVINNAEGAAYYVCHYLCKSEPDELKMALTNLISTVFKQNHNLTVFQKLWNIGCCVLKHRRMSCQEAAFRMSNLKLLQLSREVVYVNTRPLSQRYKMLKPMTELNDLPSNSTDIFHLNIVDYYLARPVDMEYMCLYEFVSWYIRCQPPKCIDANFIISKRMRERLHIEKHDVWLRKRKREAVIRYPKFSLMSDDYYFSLLMLLLPHRNENELKENYEDARSAFLNKHSFLSTALGNIHFSFLSDVENAIRRIRLAEEELHGNNVQNTCFTTDSTTEIPLNTIECFNEYALQDEITGEDKVNNSLIDNEIDFLHQLDICRMSREEFHEKYRTLTQSQKQVMTLVQNHFSNLNANSNNLCLFITGGAGVGKSFITEIIIAYLENYVSIASGISPVKVCAPTGTAARNVGGQTIHSLFKIEVSRYMNYASLPTMRLQQLKQTFCGIHTIIIDEISMVSDRMMTVISRRLSEISGSSNSFGGFNIIVVGDFYQLRPVKGRYAFHNRILWDQFTTVFLNENVRQSEDNNFCGLLNRARVGLLTSKDIDKLKSKLVDAECDKVRSLLHIYPLRKSVEKYNHEQQQILEKNLRVHTVIAEHYFSQNDKEPGRTVESEFIPDDDREVGNFHHTLRISIGTRVMLIRNILTERGLVNGAMGTVVGIEFSNNDVNGVEVLFDDSRVGQLNSFKNRDEKSHTPISITKVEHQYLIKGRHVIRKTFPLTPCWACTIHKVQGMTLDSAVIDLGSDIFERGMAYVALSRIRSLEGLHISVLNAHVICPADEVLEEYGNIRKKQNIE